MKSKEKKSCAVGSSSGIIVVDVDDVVVVVVVEEGEGETRSPLKAWILVPAGMIEVAARSL